MGEIGTDENFGDKTGGDRLREHCISKPKTYLLMYVPSVDWKSACWLYLFSLTHRTSSEEKNNNINPYVLHQ